MLGVPVAEFIILSKIKTVPNLEIPTDREIPLN
jgi:hypothetical protein